MGLVIELIIYISIIRLHSQAIYVETPKHAIYSTCKVEEVINIYLTLFHDTALPANMKRYLDVDFLSSLKPT